MATVRIWTNYPHNYEEDVVYDTNSFIYTNFPPSWQTIQINGHYGIVKFFYNGSTIYVQNKHAIITLQDLASEYGIDDVNRIDSTKSAMIQFVASAYLKNASSFLIPYCAAKDSTNVENTASSNPTYSSLYGKVYSTNMKRYGVEGKNITFLAFPDTSPVVNEQSVVEKSTQFLIKGGFGSTKKQYKDWAITPPPDLYLVSSYSTTTPSISWEDENHVWINSRYYTVSPEQTVLVIKYDTTEPVLTKQVTANGSWGHGQGVQIESSYHTSGIRRTAYASNNKDATNHISIVEYGATNKYKIYDRTATSATWEDASALTWLGWTNAVIEDDLTLTGSLDEGGGNMFSGYASVELSFSKDLPLIARLKFTLPYMSEVESKPSPELFNATTIDFKSGNNVGWAWQIGPRKTAVSASDDFYMKAGYCPFTPGTAWEVIGGPGDGYELKSLKPYREYPTWRLQGIDLEYYDSAYHWTNGSGDGLVALTLVSRSSKRPLYSILIIRKSLIEG